MKWILPLVLASGPVWAETCPAAPDHSARMGEIIDQLRVSKTPLAAQALNGELWQLWLQAPDDRAQALLDEGMRLRSGFELLASRGVLDELIEYCPDYVEGYNQRAFSNYLRQDFSAALVDLDFVLERMPNHIGAISGRGLTLMGMGRYDEAQEALRAAVALNPWLHERTLIDEPQGTDI